MDHDLIFLQRNRGLPSKKTIAPGLCNYTQHVINIDHRGRIFVCLCEAWLPYSVGHVMEFDKIEQIWSSPTAVRVTQSQLQGEYEYCDTQHCNVQQESRRLNSIQIYIGIDDSCQLACPSCRNTPVFDKDYDVKLPWVQRIVNWIKEIQDPRPVDVLIGSHGDPFASALYRKTISELAALEVPVRFQLRTNGLLLDRYISELNILPRLTQLEVSIDAASAETYEQVRRPGKWNALIENLEYCHQVRINQKPFFMIANFVIQQANYKEMPAFVELCRKYKMQPSFTVLQDWSTFVYQDNAVHLPTHKEHHEFLKVLAQPSVQNIIGNKLDHWIK